MQALIHNLEKQVMAYSQNTRLSQRKQGRRVTVTLSFEQEKKREEFLGLVARLSSARDNGIRASRQLLRELEKYGVPAGAMTIDGEWVN